MTSLVPLSTSHSGTPHGEACRHHHTCDFLHPKVPLSKVQTTGPYHSHSATGLFTWQEVCSGQHTLTAVHTCTPPRVHRPTPPCRDPALVCRSCGTCGLRDTCLAARRRRRLSTRHIAGRSVHRARGSPIRSFRTLATGQLPSHPRCSPTHCRRRFATGSCGCAVPRTTRGDDTLVPLLSFGCRCVASTGGRLARLPLFKIWRASARSRPSLTTTCS